jgi:hypothetical protein
MNERLIKRGKLQELKREAREKALRASVLIDRAREELALSGVTRIGEIDLEVVKTAIDEAVVLQEEIRELDRHAARLEAELGDIA